MAHLLDDIPIGPEPPRILNAIIEIPPHSGNKYEYDKAMNVFKLDRALFSPVHYPGAYGFIPRTHAEDDDPLDVLVLLDGHCFTGALIEVRPIGVLEMKDDKGLDHKILAVPTGDPRRDEMQGLQHVPRHVLREIDYFFHIYKDLEGKFADTYGWSDRVDAFRIIEEAARRYEEMETA
ncbi:MAG: inorganic diphosphatase [Phycisphaerales bacterium]|nr:inorganic diphosphatase [Phycisphaerales bacterium]